MAGELWEQRDGESAKAYRAARIYFELGAGRSLDEVSRRLYGGSDGEPAMNRPRIGHAGQVGLWARRFNWTERAAAFDAHTNGIRQDAVEQAEREKARRWVERRNLQLEQDYDRAQRLLKKVDFLAELPLVTVSKSDDGKTTVVVPISPTALRAASAIAKEASEMARAAIEAALGLARPVITQISEETYRNAERELAAWRQRMMERMKSMPTGPPEDFTGLDSASA